MGIKYIIFDIDGTLTDGKIYMGNNGEMFKAFNIKDGYAIHNILPKFNIIPIVITARTSGIVELRCAELGIKECHQGCNNKSEKLKELAEIYGEKQNPDGKYETFAYMGDDVIDLSCMALCGIVGCPADAVDEVKKISDFISNKNGGDGAAREFVEWLVK